MISASQISGEPRTPIAHTGPGRGIPTPNETYGGFLVQGPGAQCGKHRLNTRSTALLYRGHWDANRLSLHRRLTFRRRVDCAPTRHLRRTPKRRQPRTRPAVPPDKMLYHACRAGGCLGSRRPLFLYQAFASVPTHHSSRVARDHVSGPGARTSRAPVEERVEADSRLIAGANGRSSTRRRYGRHRRIGERVDKAIAEVTGLHVIRRALAVAFSTDDLEDQRIHEEGVYNKSSLRDPTPSYAAR